MTPSSQLYVKAFGEDGLENTKYPQIPAIAPERSNDKTIFWSWLIPAYLAAYLFDPHNYISNPNLVNFKMKKNIKHITIAIINPQVTP